MNLISKLKIILVCILLLLSFSVVLPSSIQAQETPEINQQMEEFGEATPVSTTDLPTFVGRIIRWVLFIIGIILIVVIIYGGLTYATAAGSQEKTDSAKKILVYAIIGMIIIALAYVLTDFIINALFESGINYKKK